MRQKARSDCVDRSTLSQILLKVYPAGSESAVQFYAVEYGIERGDPTSEAGNRSPKSEMLQRGTEKRHGNEIISRP